MKNKTAHFPPKRVTDLAEMKKWGSTITCTPTFEILPVDFAHGESQFQAYIFLCRFTGQVNGEAYAFRKCYARGCPHNLCPHVSQAVMIANRYLNRDYQKLKDAGIDIDDKRFTLQDMLVKYGDLPEGQEPFLTIHDYINIAREGNTVAVDLDLEFVSAVEHFANEKNKQTFLTGYFDVKALGKSGHYQRCLACYPTEDEKKQKALAIVVANERLSEIYQAFDQAGIIYTEQFFNY